MQHQHSCSTLECRIKILSCMVQELYIPFYPLDHYPCSNRHVYTSKALDAPSIELRPSQFQPNSQNWNSSQ